MTVWIHSPFDNLPLEGFRTQRYWLMAEAFVAAGYDVVYWTSDFNHGTKAKRKLIDRIEGKIVLKLISTCPYRKNVSLRRLVSHLLYARGLRRALKREMDHLRRPDLIISAVPMLGAAKEMLLFSHQVGARFVLDIQDAWPETFHRLGLPRIFLAPLYRTARRLYDAADCVTGVSERYRQICRRSDYKVFYHGIVSSSAPSPVPLTFTSLVYLGNLGSGYDLTTVLTALEHDPTLTLDIAGRGPQEESLLRLAREKGLSDRIRFHGYLDSTAVYELLARTSVGIIPMRDDSWVGLPYKLGDYLSAGLPVVSSLQGECGELITRERLGATYTFGNPSSFLEALKALPKVLEKGGAVRLPEILQAERIYPAYVDYTTRRVKRNA